MKLNKKEIIKIILRIDASLVKEINDIAEAKGYTRSQLLRILLRLGIDCANGKNKTTTRK